MDIESQTAESKTDERAKTRVDRIYDRIRLDILMLKLRPGEPIEEDRLAKQYGVSRTPVREALRRLERDGLVTARPHHGARVSEISLREALEIDQLRELLEPLAARMAAGKIPQEELDSLKQELSQIQLDNPTEKDYVHYLQIDVRLHEAVLRASGNRTLYETVTRLHNRMNSIRVVTTAPRYRESVDEHQNLIAALEVGDGELAEQVMREHVRQASRGRYRAFTNDGW